MEATLSSPNVGNVGIGTTTPWGELSLNPNGTTGPEFFVGTTTAANFLVTNGGKVSIGTTTPITQFSVMQSTSTPTLISSVSGMSSPRRVFVQGKYAYVSAYGADSLNIFDVSNPASPVQVGSITGIAVWDTYVQGRYAYIATNGTRLNIYDISNPTSPVQVGFPSISPPTPFTFRAVMHTSSVTAPMSWKTSTFRIHHRRKWWEQRR